MQHTLGLKGFDNNIAVVLEVVELVTILGSALFTEALKTLVTIASGLKVNLAQMKWSLTGSRPSLALTIPPTAPTNHRQLET